MNEKTVLCQTSKAPGIALLVLGILFSPLFVISIIYLDLKDSESIALTIITGLLTLGLVAASIKLLSVKNAYIYYLDQNMYFENIAFELIPKKEYENMTIEEIFAKYLPKNNTLKISKQDIEDIDVTDTKIKDSTSALTFLGGAAFGAIAATSMHKKMQNDKITIEVAEGFITIHILGGIAKQIRETLNYNDNISTIEPMKNLDELE